MIEFRLLGTLQLTDAERREVTSLLTRSRRVALLAYLAAATPRGFHRRDTLLALFWPELDQEHARAALRQALHVVRSSLGADVVLTRGDEEIGLDFDRLWCDVVAFDRAVAAGRFGEALDCYQGHLLEAFFIPGAGEFERWLETERGRLREAASRAARNLVEQSETAGDLGAAAEWARRAVQLAPHEEEPLRRLVTLLDRLGDRAAAVAAYDEFAKRLGDELETEPAAETKALLTAVRARERAAPVELPAAAPTIAAAAAVPNQPPRRRRLLWGALAVVGGVGALLALNVSSWRGRLWSGPATGQIHSLAVLPLADLSSDTLQAWYADGLTEALITDLGRIPSLRVISRGSVASFRGTKRPLHEIARELRVDAVVEGGMQVSEGRVRVDLRLVDAASGYQLWANRFEEPIGDRFLLEDHAARGIVSALRVPVTAAEERHLRTAPTRNVAAYDLYLRGKVRIRHESRADDSVAIDLLERAVALDPEFGVAHAELAHAYALRVTQFVPGDSEARDRAAVETEKALRLDPDLAEGHYARAFLLWGPGGHFAHELAIQEDRRALDLNPNLAEAHQHLGMVYLHIGLLDNAIEEFRKTLAIDPSHRFAQQRIGIALVYQGRYEDGLRTFQQVPPEFNPAFWHSQVAWALLYLGQDSAAASLIEQYLRQRPEDPGGVVTSTRAIVFAKQGDERRAEEDIRTAVQKGAGYIHFHHSEYYIAMAYALLHRPQPALRFLRRAAAEGMPCYPCFANDPYLAMIQSDPGVTAFMRELHAQWQRYKKTF
jgi:TolB-like protein/DNA-binding SARP family transcriptional activator/Tfp pilus assembly protein PilF